MGRAGLKHGIVALVIWAAIAGSSYAGSISLVGNGYIPEPNEEVTVYIRTDTPLFGMVVTGCIIGDATITDVMNEMNCTEYGWDPGWTGGPYIDSRGWVDLCGISWTSDANGIVGYFRFIYHGGEVTTVIVGEAYDYLYQPVPFSSVMLSFGEPDPNMPNNGAGDPNQGGGGGSSTTGAIIAARGVRNLAPCVPQLDGTDAYYSYLHPTAVGQTATNSVQSLGDPLVYDVNTVMTENTIWSQDVTLNGTITIEGCQLVIMPGVTVSNASGSGGIVVRNNGVLIATGTSENRIGFIPTSATPTEGEYPFAIKIEETASPSCVINLCVVMFAERGIWIDNNRLDRPIEQLTINRCGDGIYQEGPRLTDVFNNEMINCVFSGIEVYLADANDPNNTCSADTFIAIEHNSIIGWNVEDTWGQFYGITIHGSPYLERMGYVALADNLIAGSYSCAMNMGGGYINCDGRYNHGYFNNWEIDTGDPWGDINPRISMTCPFYYGYYYWPYLLRPDSIFVDGGVMTVEETGYLIGQSTFFGIPDVNTADIGFHYNREGYVNAGVNPLWGDLNNDFGVDANDLLMFSSHWLEDPNSSGYDARMEFVDPNRIDLRDYAYLAYQWKHRTSPIPQDVGPGFDRPASDIMGDVTVSIGMPTYNIKRAFLLMDGKIVDEFGGLAKEPNSLKLPSARFPSGSHKFKLVYITDSNAIYATSPLETTFTNAVYQMRSAESFHPSDANNRLLSGYYYGSETLNVAVRDDVSDVSLWSDSYTGHSFNVIVPGSAFGDSQICSLLLAESSGTMTMMTTSASADTEMQLHKKFRPADWQGKTVRMAIILPNPDISTIRRVGLLECARACQKRDVPWAALYEHDVNESNLAYLLADRTDVRYVYWTGHGDSFVGRNTVKGIAGVQRTSTSCWRSRQQSLWGSKYQEIGAFSRTQQTWPAAPTLPFEWDQRGFDMGLLGMAESNRKKIVFVDTCNSACYDDMADIYGMNSLSGYSSNDQIYVGWKKPVETSEAIASKFMTDTKETVRLFWEGMGNGKDVYDAVDWAYTNTNDVWLKTLLWGDDGPQDISNPNSHTAIGIFGRSGGLDNKLEP